MEQRDSISCFTNKENLKVAERRLTGGYVALPTAMLKFAPLTLRKPHISPERYRKCYGGKI